MPKPYPREFRDDVVRVARSREPGTLLKQIATDFGISESCLTGWLKVADLEDGIKPGTAGEDVADATRYVNPNSSAAAMNRSRSGSRQLSVNSWQRLHSFRHTR